MHSKSDNMEIMISNEADEAIKELFYSLKKRYQNNLESMKGSEFVFDYVQLLYYKCHEINLNCGGLYLDYPDWIKSSSNKFYQYKGWEIFTIRVTVALNHEEIGKNPEK